MTALVDSIRDRKPLTHIFLILGSIVMIYPLLWMLSSSFKPEGVIFRDLGLIPDPFVIQNYTEGWTALQSPFTRFFVNSFLIVGLTILGNLITCSVTAYAFARINFRFKRVWFALMLSTIMLPYHVTVVPQYMLFNALGWVNTFFPLFVPNFFATNAFFVFLIVQFIRGIPRDLDDAAAVDGASKFQIYIRIILPLTTPALITTAIFTFIWTWNDFFSQLIYLNDINLFTVPLALRQFTSAMDESSFGALFAMSILALIPTFIFFIAAQKYLVQGISTTGFKG